MVILQLVNTVRYMQTGCWLMANFEIKNIGIMPEATETTEKPVFGVSGRKIVYDKDGKP